MGDNLKKIGRTLGVFAVVAGGFALYKGTKLLSSAKMKFALIGFKIHKFDVQLLRFSVTLRCYNPTSSDTNIAINGITAMYQASAIANSIPNIQGITIPAGNAQNIEIMFEAPYLSLLNKGLLSVINNTEQFKANLSFAINLSVNGEELHTTQTLSNENMAGLGQLGLVSGPRNTKDGREFNHLIKKVRGKDLFIKNGGVNETVEACIDIVSQHYNEVEDLAKTLIGSNKKESCANIFNFAYPYLQYKNDKQGVEQLRTPARSWYDGQIRFKQQGISDAGIDCDDFSMFVGSLLKCMNIPFKFRISEYDNKGYYQHIYVIVPCPEDSEGEIVIDPVLSKFDYQKPYSAEKSDFNMKPIAMAGLSGYDLSGTTGLGMPIMMLSGVDDTNDDLMGIISGIDFDNAISGLGSADDATLNYLKRTSRYITANPKSISHVQNPKQFLEMINAAIANWHTANRDKVLDKLIEIESDLIENGFIKMDDVAIEGLDEVDDFEDDSLGRSSSSRKAKRKKRRAGFFHSVKNASKKVGHGLKKTAKFVVRFNPLSVAVRAGLLAALRLNMFKYSSKLKYAYLPDELASKYNIDLAKLAQIKKAHSKVEKLFKGLQGKEKNLKKAILKGSKEKSKDYSLNGINELESEIKRLQGLGELGVVATATSITAASGVLAKIGSWLNPIKNVFKPKTENKTENHPIRNFFKSRKVKQSPIVSTPTAYQPVDKNIPSQEYASSVNPSTSNTSFAQSAKSGMTKKKKLLIGGIGVLALTGGIIYIANNNNNNTPKKTAKSTIKAKRSLGSIDLK